MATTIDETNCVTCGVRLVRHWRTDGLDFSWLDEHGRRDGGDGGPPGIENVYQYLDWLQERDMCAYSSFSAVVGLGGWLLPWQHWHRPGNHSMVVWEPGEMLPDCCGMPAQLVRDGWVCREDSRHRPVSVFAAAPTVSVGACR